MRFWDTTSLAFPSNRALVVDTSVLIAILLREEGWESLRTALRGVPQVYLSAATYVELFVVAQRRFGLVGSALIRGFLAEYSVQIIPFDEQQARLAADAYATYGKGRHPAALNFGDCFSYALAMHLDQPLLFKGNDFRQTDIRIVTLPDQAIPSSRRMNE